MMRRALYALLSASLVLSSSAIFHVSAGAAGVPTCRARIAAPGSAKGGSSVAIADKSTGPPGARVTSRAWFFGDGSSAAGRSAGALVHHRYPLPKATMTKRYTIRLLLAYSDGARCSADASILIYNGKHLKGYTKLDLRGSTISIRDIEPVPNCGNFDVTMHWQPQFGVERTYADGLPNFLLFGIARITSKGSNDSTSLPIAVFLAGPIAVTGSAPTYGMEKMHQSDLTRSCSKKIELTGFERGSLLMLPPTLVKIESGGTKLKCTAAKAGKPASCKIDPSKTLTVVGSEAIDNEVFFHVNLKIHFPKKTCAYVGPAKVSPLAVQQAAWYKC